METPTTTKTWHDRKIQEFTLEDAIQVYEETGMCCVCADGKIKHLAKEALWIIKEKS